MVDPMVFGSGKIEVPEHLLLPGATQAPPNPERSVELSAGECGTEVRVRLTLEATEVVVDGATPPDALSLDPYARQIGRPFQGRLLVVSRCHPEAPSEAEGPCLRW